MPDVDLPLPCDSYVGDEPYVFASYAHKDGRLVFPELSALHARGVRIWFDEGIDPGNEWPEHIARALDKASVFLVFVTQAAVASRNVRNEVNYALSEGKPFLAVYLEETKLPPGMQLRMGDIQAIMKWRMTPEHYARKLASALPPAVFRAAGAAAAVAVPPPTLAVPVAEGAIEVPVTAAQVFGLPAEGPVEKVAGDAAEKPSMKGAAVAPPPTDRSAPESPRRRPVSWRLVVAVCAFLAVTVPLAIFAGGGGLGVAGRSNASSFEVGINAAVTRFRLFESGRVQPATGDRHYAARFSAGTARFIDYEMALNTWAPDKVTMRVPVECTYYRSDSSVIATIHDTVIVQAGFRSDSRTGGWGSEKAGFWRAGSYRVTCDADGHRMPFADAVFAVVGAAP